MGSKLPFNGSGQKRETRPLMKRVRGVANRGERENLSRQSQKKKRVKRAGTGIKKPGTGPGFRED
jgi:hypothetical protein